MPSLPSVIFDICSMYQSFNLHFIFQSEHCASWPVSHRLWPEPRYSNWVIEMKNAAHLRLNSWPFGCQCPIIFSPCHTDGVTISGNQLIDWSTFNHHRHHHHMYRNYISGLFVDFSEVSTHLCPLYFISMLHLRLRVLHWSCETNITVKCDLSGRKVTLVAFDWLFSTVFSFQLYPHIACWRCITKLAALLWFLFSSFNDFRISILLLHIHCLKFVLLPLS